jgi:arylsulfatase
LYRDTQREPEDPQGRHATELFANEAIRFISDQKKADPEKPFFLYFATGATHSPIQVGKEWIDKYKGKFDKGWDWYREETLARQKKLGVVPADAQLAPQNPNVSPWNDLSENEKKIVLRQIETYAGFVSHTDHEVGRLIDYIEQIGQLDNTLVVLLIGDNGSAPGAGVRGRFLPEQKGETKDQLLVRELENIDLLGSEKSKPAYPIGWAAATNTPFRFYKGNPCYEGGTHDPLILFYPAKIKEKNGIRNQYSYINDIFPTTLELIGVKAPAVVNGYKQDAVEGTSLAYSIDNKNAPERHTIQYHEMTGSYALYKDGWKAVFPNGIANRAVDANIVYLYNLKEDFNEIHNLADKYPEKVKELAKAFEAEAWKYNVYPLKHKWENVNPYNKIKQKGSQ